MPLANELDIDTLGEIFVCCVEEEQAVRSERAARCESSQSGQAGRWLSQVCRLWRYAALSTPRLWRFVQVDLKTNGQAPLRTLRIPPFAESSLRRSGACPLQLSFVNLGSEEALSVVKALAGFESEWSKRLERLEIGLVGAAFLPYLSVLRELDISNVKELVLYHMGYFTVHEFIPPESILSLEQAPNLCRLSLGRIQWATSEIILGGITHLAVDLGHKHEALLLQALSCFPALVELVLLCTDHVRLTESWEPIPAATLPSLERITFDPRICHYSLHRLDAPKLTNITARNFSRLSPRFLAYLPGQTTYTTLRIESFAPEDDWMSKQIDTAQWTYNSIEHLKVEWTRSFAAGVPGFISCLRNHPEILTLELVDCTIDNEYLCTLSTDSTLLPNLRLLSLTRCPWVSPTLLHLISSYRRSLKAAGDFIVKVNTA